MQLMASSTSSTSSSVEVPQFFLCPISLQIMKDPVTTVTGITYDRTSIERWLFSDNNTTCPLTNQPIIPNKSSFSNSHIDNNSTYTLLPDILTPNHTLRRLIQAWCTTNSVDRIPTPRPPIDRLSAAALLFDLSHPDRQLKSLNRMAALVHESQSNRRTFVNLDAARFLLKTVVSCSNKHQFDRVDLALNVVLALRIPNDELKPLVVDNYQLLDALGQVLLSEPVRSGTVVLFLKTVTELASASLLERLKPEFIGLVVGYIKDRHHVNKYVTRAALHVLLSCCPWGRNRIKMVEAGAVNELIELELNNGLKENKRCTEIVMGLLEHLCGCAEGRAELVGHPAGISVVAKRILRVSPSVDEAAVGILSALARNAATGEVLMEMLSVGAVSKLCFVLQADCSNSVREKARWVLRLHSGAWKNSECISMNLLTIYPQSGPALTLRSVRRLP